MVAKDTSKVKNIAQKITMVPSVGICFDPIAQWQRQYERELRIKSCELKDQIANHPFLSPPYTSNFLLNQKLNY